jgi:AAA+ superfamily predicted ATPase
MSTLSIQNGPLEQIAPDTGFVEQQLNWLSQVIEARLKLYFGHESPVQRIDELPDSKGGWYTQQFPFYELSFADKIMLWLSAAPFMKPQLLDCFYVKNADIDNRFSEFGGLKPAHLNGLLPTLDTLLFILAGDDMQQRIYWLNHFHRHHFLFASNLVRLDPPSSHEPFTASVIVATDDFTELLLRGREYAPEFSHTFPAKKLTTEQEWEDLVLDENTKTQIEEIRTWVEVGDEMLDQLELRKKIKPGYRSLFFGPPGTGKTFTAALLGKYTGYDVYRIDLSLIISKYIGETEKNLTQIFDRAEHKKWILFFDEADALFGKRTQVKDSHDRYANQEVSFLLQRVEDYSGLIILATNLKSNIDEAFARRFQSLINFQMPRAKERLLIWQHTFSSKTFFAGDVDLPAISRDFEISGGSITNVVRYCSLLAMRRDPRMIYQADIIDGIRKEFQKEGKTI